MGTNKQIPETSSYTEIAEFGDMHSLVDYWEQTEPVEFEIDPNARRRYLRALDPDLLQRVQKLARLCGCLQKDRPAVKPPGSKYKAIPAADMRLTIFAFCARIFTSGCD